MSTQQLSKPAIEVPHRGLVTAAVMMSMIMVILDMTIANVALPHMQASLGAAQDTITWVLTSYIVAQAIATPITGWLADNIGRKRLFAICVAGFVGSSALCGTALGLEEMVLFRVMQGAFGAALAPLSQSVILDINPRERHGQAMAVWGMGIMIAPILGPIIGAYLTDNFNWRWVFYINVPVGLAALTGVILFMPDSTRRIRKFDFLGFGLPPGSPSLGELLAQGKDNIHAPWLGLTGFAVISIMLSLLIFVGEAVRDAFDPRKTFS